MKTKFTIKDLPLLIKNDRRFQIGVVVLFLIFIWPLIDPTKNNKKTGMQHLKPPVESSTGKTPESEVGQDLVTAFKQDLDGVHQEVAQIKDNVDKQGQNLKDFETRTAEIFKKVLERVSENENNNTSAPQAAAEPKDFPDATAQAIPAAETEKLEPFGESEEELPVPAPPPPAKLAFIGAGDSVSVQLLSGVNAPTDGTPYPVVFKLSGNVMGPDGSVLPLGEARLIAAAQGSLTDSRALFRLTSMNLRLPNGRRKVIGVDGWIVGEDGVRGMSGILIDPIGKAIAGAGFTGALAGLGEGIAASNTTTTSSYGQQSTYISGSVGEVAAGRGLSSAANTWSDIIKQRLELLVPVVQVYSDRQATAVFAKSIVVPDLYDALEEEDSSTSALD